MFNRVFPPGHTLRTISRDDVVEGTRLTKGGDVHGSVQVFHKDLGRLLPLRNNMAVIVDDRMDV